MEFSADEHLTSYSELVLFQAMFRSMELKATLRRCFQHMHQQAAYDLGTLSLLLITHFLIGYRELRGLDDYRGDPMVLRLLGLKRLPDVSTVSRAMLRIHAQGVDSLRATMRDMVLERLQLSLCQLGDLGL